MAMLNPFDTDAFNLVSMVSAINILPNNYGLLGTMGLFRGEGVTTRSIMVEEQNGTLNLLKTLPVGSPGQKNDSGRRVVRSFSIPHIPLDDVLLPSEYEGLRGFGSESAFETVAKIMNNKLQTMKNKHDITHEYQRMGALKGILYDSDLSVIYNYFQEFLIDKKSVDFLLGTAATNVKGKCTEVRRHIEDNLMGEIMTGDPLVLCNASFWDKLTNHTTVKTAFERWNDGAFLRDDLRVQGFPFGGLRFKEYRGTATTHDGVTRNFLDTDYGIAFPLGTQDVFSEYYAPADFTETTNTVGLPYYAKQKYRDFNRGIDIHTQSNTLAICKRPGVIVEVYTSN